MILPSTNSDDLAWRGRATCADGVSFRASGDLYAEWGLTVRSRHERTRRLREMQSGQAGPHRPARDPARSDVPEDRIYLDHGLTGTNRDRPGLAQALAAVRA